MWKPRTRSLGRDTITHISLSLLKCLEEREKLHMTSQMKDGVLYFLVRTCFKFLKKNVGKDCGVLLKGNKPHKPVFAYDIAAYLLSE